MNMLQLILLKNKRALESFLSLPLSSPSLSPLKDMMSQTAFQLLIILPQTLARWDYRHVPHGDVLNEL